MECGTITKRYKVHLYYIVHAVKYIQLYCI